MKIKFFNSFLFLTFAGLLLVQSCQVFGFGKQDPASEGSFAKEPSFVEDFDSIDSSIWNVARWKEHGGQTSDARCYAEDGMLKMLFRYDPSQSGVQRYQSSAIQSKTEFLYGRWEARLKPTDVPGVLNSFYTIDWIESGPRSRQEIDIEFLTYTFNQNSGRVHFAVHEPPNNKDFNTVPAYKLDFNPSDDFHVWGYEITPESIKWFVDDTYLYTYEYEGGITIDQPYTIKLNHWSQPGWVNGPPEANVTCTYLIDWIKFYPYVEK